MSTHLCTSSKVLKLCTKSSGKEPFTRVLKLRRQRSVFNDRRYYFARVHPLCNNHQSRGHFAYEPLLKNTNQCWRTFGLRITSKWKVKSDVNLEQIYCVYENCTRHKGLVILDLYSPDHFETCLGERQCPILTTTQPNHETKPFRRQNFYYVFGFTSSDTKS